MPKYMPKKNTMDAHKIKDSSLGLSYPMLTRSNYTVWSLKMRVLMQAHAIWEAVEPTDPKAVVDNKIDKMALAVIFQAVQMTSYSRWRTRNLQKKHGRR